MDADTSKVIYFLEQFWTFFAVSFGVALGGIAAKRFVSVFVPAEARMPSDHGPYRTSAAVIAADASLPTWYRLWRATISIHPVIVGGLAGLAPIPAASWVPDGVAPHVLWFALAGAISGQVYEISRRIAETIPAVVRGWFGRVPVEPTTSPPPSDPPKDGA
jgi:hypothetical protein